MNIFLRLVYKHMPHHLPFLEDVVECTNQVCSGNAPPLETVGEPRVYENDEEEFRDEMRPLKSIATNFVTEEFLKSRDTTEALLETVVVGFEVAISRFIKLRKLPNGSITLLYKGGNVLNTVLERSLRALPIDLALPLSKRYAPYFKRSDADFQLSVDPTLRDYDRTFDDVTTLARVVLGCVRRRILRKPTRY